MFSRLFCVLVCLSFFPLHAHAGREDKIYTLPAEYIARYVDSTKGQKRVLMIYASWCPSCVRKMPRIMDIERVRQGSVIAVSIDDNHSDFARYVRKMRTPPFKIILSRDSEAVLQNTLQSYGVKEWEYIPHIVLLDAHNNVVQQGSLEVEDVARFILSQ